MELEKFLVLGFVIIIIGIAVMAYGIIKSTKVEAEGGGAVVIGPFPIAFGTSETLAKIMMIVAIVLALTFIFFFLLSGRAIFLP